MKKIKLLTPLLSLTSIVTIVAPLTSCVGGEEGSKSNPFVLSCIVQDPTMYNVVYKSKLHNIEANKEYTYTLVVVKVKETESGAFLPPFGVTCDDMIKPEEGASSLDFSDETVTVTVDNKKIVQSKSDGWYSVHNTSLNINLIGISNSAFNVGSKIQITLKFKQSLNNAFALIAK